MSEVILRRRNPLDVIRYVLQNLEKQAIAAGSYPTLIHEGLEAEEKVRAEVERLRAEAWAGHREDCGGIDEVEGRCACGWLQHESAHDYILNLTRERDEARAERDAAWVVRDAGWVQTEDALTRMRTAEAEVARLEGLILDWDAMRLHLDCEHVSVSNLGAEARRIRDGRMR